MPKFMRKKWKAHEKSLLQAVYALNKTPDSEEISSLSVLFDCDSKHVKHWFQNSRQRNYILTKEDVYNGMILCTYVNPLR